MYGHFIVFIGFQLKKFGKLCCELPHCQCLSKCTLLLACFLAHWLEIGLEIKALLKCCQVKLVYKDAMTLNLEKLRYSKLDLKKIKNNNLEKKFKVNV